MPIHSHGVVLSAHGDARNTHLHAFILAEIHYHGSNRRARMLTFIIALKLSMSIYSIERDMQEIE